MFNKKSIAVILTFAIVATLLTFYRRPDLMMGMQGNDGVSYSIPAPQGYGYLEKVEVGAGNVGIVPPGEPDKAMRGMQSNGMYTDVIMPRPYYDDALSVDQRVYDHSAYQSVVVSNVSEYMRQVKEYLQSNGGRIMHVSQYTTNDLQYAYVDARIPAEKFDEATGLFASRAKKIISESLNTQDVTGQQKSMSDQLMQLEEQKATKATQLSSATTLADRQRIQSEIDRLNSMIDSLKDSQAKFAEEIKYATVSLTLSDSERFYNPEKGGTASDEFRSALVSLKRTAKMLGLFAIWIAVYAVIWLPVVFVARWIWAKLNPATPAKK